MGSSYGETEPRKATYEEAVAQHKIPDFTGARIPAEFSSWISARVQGIQWLNWFHLTEQTIELRERIKTN
jgi:hypothetical protein